MPKMHPSSAKSAPPPAMLHTAVRHTSTLVRDNLNKATYAHFMMTKFDSSTPGPTFDIFQLGWFL